MSDGPDAGGFRDPDAAFRDTSFEWESFFEKYDATKQSSSNDGDPRASDERPYQSDRRPTFPTGGAEGMFSGRGYDHEAVVRRYRDYVCKRIRFWDPADEAAAAEAEAEGKKFKPRTTSLMLGVRRTAPGQTVEQMLEVRSLIRQMAARNARLRQELLDAIDVNSPGYGEQYEQLQAEAIEHFINEFFEGPAELLPDTVSQSREWLKKLDAHHFNSLYKYDNLNAHGNAIATELDVLNNLFNFGHAMRAAFLVRLVVLGGMCWSTGMRPGILLYGDMSTSKTYLYKANEQLMQPGCFESYTHQTVLSQTGDTDADCKVRTQDECSGALVGDDSDTRDASVLKSIATDKIVRSSHLHTEDGNRTAVTSVRSCIGTICLATNNPIRDPKRSPWLARLILWQLKRPSPEDQASIEEKIYKLGMPEETLARKEMKRNSQLLSFYVLFVEMAIGAGVIKDVSMQSAIIYFQQFNEYMKTQGHGIENPKSVVHVQEIARTLTIFVACHVVFTGPQSREWRYENGEPLPFRRIAARALREVERLLVPSLDVCVFAYTLLGHMWIDAGWPEVCAAAREAIFGDEYPERVNLKAGVQITDPPAKTTNLEFFEEMQARINERVDDTARSFRRDRRAMHDAFAEAHADTSGAATSSRQPPPPPAPPSRASDARQHDIAQDPRYVLERAKSFETEMPAFLRAEVQTPFLTRRRKVGTAADDVLLAIDPNYIELPAAGAQESVHSVARKLCNAAHSQALEGEVAVKQLLHDACKEEIDTPIYTYDMVAGKIIIDPRYAGRKVRQSAVIMVASTDPNVFRYRTDQSDKGVRLFIATHLVVTSSDVHTILLKAVQSMAYRFTLPRNVLTALCVRAPRYSEPRFHGRDAFRTYWELLRVVELKPNKHKPMFVVRNPQVFSACHVLEAVAQQMSTREGFDYDELERALAEHRYADTNNMVVSVEPDVMVGIRRCQELGLPQSLDEKYLWPLLYEDIKELSGQCGVYYPHSQLKEMQRNQDRAAMSRRAADHMSHRTMHHASQPLRLNASVLGRLRANGGAMATYGLLWDGKRETNPVLMNDADRNKHYTETAEARTSRDASGVAPADFVDDNKAADAIERRWPARRFERDANNMPTSDKPTLKVPRRFDYENSQRVKRRRQEASEEVRDYVQRRQQEAAAASGRAAMSSSAPAAVDPSSANTRPRATSVAGFL